MAGGAARPGDRAVSALEPGGAATGGPAGSGVSALGGTATGAPAGTGPGTLRWTDGFVFALTIPAALVATLGYSIGALGGWGAVALWTASMLIATAANWVYSELAAMFPRTPGGISLYAHEGWRERFPLAGPVGAFGYWFGWSGALAVYGVIIGELVRARWAPGADPDAVRALRVSALFSLAVFALLPLGLAGAVGERAAAADPVGFYAVALDRIAAGWADPLLVLVIGGLGLVMLTCMAGSSRALRAIAAQATAVRVLVPLNRHGAPARCMGVDLVTNLALIVLLGDLLAILAAGNLGYVLAHVLALSAFVVLRRDRPDLARPVRLPAVFVPLAAGLALLLAAVTVVGALAFDVTGYGGTTELLVALGVLSAAAALFARGGQ